MRAHPGADWRIADVQAVCRSYGFRCSPPSGGSHFKVAHDQLEEMLSIPFAKPIKPVYIRRLVSMIDAVGAKS